jgi:PleD family two-component response regulator
MTNAKSRIAIIADDEDIGRLLLAESVAAVGLTSLAFENGQEALDAALNSNPAIVLLDVDMPGMDGYAVCKSIRSKASHATVPIVMVTGHEDSMAIGRAFEAGATDFISKPVNWALLSRRLEYILRNAAAAENIERLAYFDSLTGLPNRQRCLETADKLFGAAAESNESVAVIYLDLNSFKRVNDTFGHAVGDAILKTVADKLTQSMEGSEVDPDQMILARFGGESLFGSLRCAAHASKNPLRTTGSNFIPPPASASPPTPKMAMMSPRCSSTPTQRCIKRRPTPRARL